MRRSGRKLTSSDARIKTFSRKNPTLAIFAKFEILGVDIGDPASNRHGAAWLTAVIQSGEVPDLVQSFLVEPVEEARRSRPRDSEAGRGNDGPAPTERRFAENEWPVRSKEIVGGDPEDPAVADRPGVRARHESIDHTIRGEANVLRVAPGITLVAGRQVAEGKRLTPDNLTPERVVEPRREGMQDPVR